MATLPIILLKYSPDFPSGFPALPEIKDAVLLEQTFTHRSYLSRPVEPFLDPSHPRDYESLEHLGDSVLNMCVTDVIRKQYPDLRPGGATVSIISSPLCPMHNHVFQRAICDLKERQVQDHQ